MLLSADEHKQGLCMGALCRKKTKQVATVTTFRRSVPLKTSFQCKYQTLNSSQTLALVSFLPKAAFISTLSRCHILSAAGGTPQWGYFYRAFQRVQNRKEGKLNCKGNTISRQSSHRSIGFFKLCRSAAPG